ncbi:hypothetical protein TTHERM_00770870 (macronuclear) [Tetrahymena thermophila SB210]|uniref:Transmembrane protein n=1 Tax=Tetrahymena thermophila (strain SB210) TaxID=312017 RepID=Q23AQ9_TETTS|nr:hypothetical protein TTHERM_00770870 [Tetrahymena thermophila SB210]EAR93633.1 hypothetical protein TTHERM_00770870 [Tetrahymena thermophila SB210]|eukprot:XP_001013878.1 hypothetical protein TTHERM_00770870 [Tetrahymena thermophila SB210]
MRTYKLISLLILVSSALSCTNFSDSFTSCVYTYCQQDLNCYNQAIWQLECGVNQCQTINDATLWYNCFVQSFSQTCYISYQNANNAREFCLDSYDFSQDCTNIDSSPSPSHSSSSGAQSGTNVVTITTGSNMLFMSLTLMTILTFLFA